MQVALEPGLMATAVGLRGHPTHHLTDKGLALKSVIIALTKWGDRSAAPDGPPIMYEHDGYGGHVRRAVLREMCGESSAREGYGPKDRCAGKTSGATEGPAGHGWEQLHSVLDLRGANNGKQSFNRATREVHIVTERFQAGPNQVANS